MVHVTSIRSNVKAGASCQLGAKTLIVGPNGSGKTSILNAITLALTGTAYDVAGAVSTSQAADIARHLGHGGDDLFSQAQLSDGYTVEWRRVGTTTTLPSDSPLDVQTLSSDLLTGSNESKRAALNKLASPLSTDVDFAYIRQSYPDITLAALDEYVQAHADLSLMLPIERMTTVSARANEQVKAEKKKVAQLNAVIAGMAGAAGSPVSDADMAEAQRAQEAAGTIMPGAVTAAAKAHATAQQQTATANIDRLTSEIDVINAHLVEWTAYRDSLPAAEPAFPHDLATAILRVAEYADSLVRAGHHSCVMCGGAQDPTAAVQQLANLRTWAQEQAAPVDDPRAAADAQIAEITARLRQVTQQMQAAVTAKAQADSVIAAPLAEVDPEQIQATAARVANYDLRRAAHIKLAAERTNLMQAEKTLKTAEVVGDIATKLLRALLTDALSKLEAAVSKYMPEGMTFAVVEQTPHILIGFKDRFGQFRSAASGAEEASILLALAAFRQEASARGQVIIAPERQWSPERLAQTMKALEGAPGQVIIVSTVMPAGRISRATWTVVDTSKQTEAPKTTVVAPPKSGAIPLTHNMLAPLWLHGWFIEMRDTDLLDTDLENNGEYPGVVCALPDVTTMTLMARGIVCIEQSGEYRYFMPERASG